MDNEQKLDAARYLYILLKEEEMIKEDSFITSYGKEDHRKKIKYLKLAINVLRAECGQYALFDEDGKEI